MEVTELLNKHKNKIINIAVIIIALIIANKVYEGQVSRVESLREKKETESKINDVLGEISQLDKKLDTYNNLLSGKDPGLTLNTISNIAKQSNVRILSIKPGSEERFPEYVKLPFDLTITAANYHTLGKFISNIENHQNVYIVEGLGSHFDKEQKRLSVNLRISAITAEK